MDGGKNILIECMRHVATGAQVDKISKSRLLPMLKMRMKRSKYSSLFATTQVAEDAVPFNCLPVRLPLMN